jgi:Flp pilus assembly protein TadG
MTGPAHRAVAGRWRTSSTDTGSAALELVILAPILLALLSLVIAAGRTTVAQGSVDAAARDAARQASIALTPSAAQTAALVSARAALRQDGLDCNPAIVIDTSQFTSVPVGQPAAVTAVVTCAVPLASLALPGIPGTARLSASFTSPLDTYRARSTGLGVLRALIRMNTGMGKR